jgi:hypothetical protein
MNARYLHPSARKNRSAARPGSGAAVPAAPPAVAASRACCCPAKAVVRVTMPPASGRPGEIDLLLCAHHYRASRRALASARASVRELPGTVGDVTAWIRLAG